MIKERAKLPKIGQIATTYPGILHRRGHMGYFAGLGHIALKGLRSRAHSAGSVVGPQIKPRQARVWKLTEGLTRAVADEVAHRDNFGEFLHS